MGFFIYFFNLNNQLFWDDEDWIINNNFVHAISWTNIKFWLTHNVLAGVGFQSNYYRPFLFFTFAFNYVISGVEPLFWHLTSNFIHLANAVIVFILLKKFAGKLIAFITALIFTIHPLQTEAVAYISGRGDSLVAMFILLALWFFMKDISRPAIRYKLIAISFLVLGLLSRETGIVFPFLALFLYVSFVSKEKFLVSIKKGLVKTWPYFGMVIFYVVLRLTYLNFVNTLNFYTEPNLYSENLHIRLFTFLPILWQYLKLLLVPVGLHMERGSIVYTSFFQWPVWPIGLAIVGLLYYLIASYKKEQFNNSTVQQFNNFRIWLFGLSWFFIALGPVSGITPINALMYEHWLYLPMIGFWLIVSFYLTKALQYLKKAKNIVGYWVLITGLAVYFSFFCFQAIKRNILWGMPIEFYHDLLKYEPNSLKINNNLGNLYLNENDVKKAEFYYRKATEENSAFAQPYYNLGSILQSRGDIGAAIQLFDKAIIINPDFFYSYQNLAVIYAQQGNLIKAVDNIEKLKKIIPENPRIYYNSALVYIALNDKGQALRDLGIGLKYADLDPQTGELMKELIKELQK